MSEALVTRCLSTPCAAGVMPGGSAADPPVMASMRPRVPFASFPVSRISAISCPIRRVDRRFSSADQPIRARAARDAAQ